MSKLKSINKSIIDGKPLIVQKHRNNKDDDTSIPKLYPNCDEYLWLRSCDHEIIEPINGKLFGTIPKWINGSLLRNGPGSLNVGTHMKFNHLFDSSALLHRFSIQNGNATYQCRFVQTETYKKNKAANRIVVTEFGTSSVPDPCHTIFDKISAIFKPAEQTDNTMISIYPFGDEYFTFTETPVMHNIDIETLETKGKVNVADYIGIVNHTSHPHILNNGTTYNLGMTITTTGPAYNIICFPKGTRTFDDAHIVATIPARWKLHPSYMHTFGITKNYYIIVEQPLSISVAKVIKTRLLNRPTASCFKWFANQGTFIYLICRHSGQLKFKFQTDAFFYLHMINQYEKDNTVIVDICCYKDPGMLDCMYVEAMENLQNNPNYATLFRGRPLRFILPINDINGDINSRKLNQKSTTDVKKKSLRIFRSVIAKIGIGGKELRNSDAVRNQQHDNNKSTLINLDNTKAMSFVMDDGSIYCKAEKLCDLGCETPQIYYNNYLGKEYRYFYAISSDVDAVHTGTLIKVDVMNKTTLTWFEESCNPSEPIFVPTPNGMEEDDGVILSAMVWQKQENRVGLLVLSAKDMTEIGRCEFDTPGSIPKCLHGWFAPNL